MRRRRRRRRVFHSKSTGIFPKITFSLLQYYLKGN
jgi:hypothetical protein